MKKEVIKMKKIKKYDNYNERKKYVDNVEFNKTYKNLKKLIMKRIIKMDHEEFIQYILLMKLIKVIY